MGEVTTTETWYSVTKVDGVTAVECTKFTDHVAWIVYSDYHGERKVRRKNRVSDWERLFRTFDEVKVHLKKELESELRYLEFQLANIPARIEKVKTQLNGVDTLVPPAIQKPKVKTESTNGN